MLYRMSLSRYFVLAGAIMNVIAFSIVFVLFVLLRRTLANQNGERDQEGGIAA